MNYHLVVDHLPFGASSSTFQTTDDASVVCIMKVILLGIHYPSLIFKNKSGKVSYLSLSLYVTGRRDTRHTPCVASVIWPYQSTSCRVSQAWETRLSSLRCKIKPSLFGLRVSLKLERHTRQAWGTHTTCILCEASSEEEIVRTYHGVWEL